MLSNGFALLKSENISSKTRWTQTEELNSFGQKLSAEPNQQALPLPLSCKRNPNRPLQKKKAHSSDVSSSKNVVICIFGPGDHQESLLLAWHEQVLRIQTEQSAKPFKG